MSKIKKPTYEELESRFQNYCKHDGGTAWSSEGKFCAICLWPDGKCQHRKSDSWDKFCRECGAPLKKEGGAA